MVFKGKLSVIGVGLRDSPSGASFFLSGFWLNLPFAPLRIHDLMCYL